jgi:divalent metal cation (Fe/Co/Zn/Cd) transporter
MPMRASSQHLPEPAATPKNPSDRVTLIRQALLFEYLTLAWMILEAAVTIGSGIAANSLVLVAFGIDSIIELASAAVLLWRLVVELRHGQSFAEDAEKRASRIGGALLFLLAAYVVAAAGWKIWTRQGADFSLSGLLVSALAIPIMYLLARRKLKIARELGSHALRADAIESLTCGWLALVVVVALAAQLLVGAWWVDAFASLAIVWFLIREGREAWEGRECCDHE